MVVTSIIVISPTTQEEMPLAVPVNVAIKQSKTHKQTQPGTHVTCHTVSEGSSQMQCKSALCTIFTFSAKHYQYHYYDYHYYTQPAS